VIISLDREKQGDWRRETGGGRNGDGEILESSKTRVMFLSLLPAFLLASSKGRYGTCPYDRGAVSCIPSPVSCLPSPVSSA
jgi:hypothetical protein